MKKALIVTYYWPPAGGPGVQRWLKFVKYLKEFNWEPVVVTVKNGTYPAIDNSLEKDIPDNTVVYKIPTSEPFGLYNFFKRRKGKSGSVAFINMKKKGSLLDKLSIFIRANLYIPDARKGWKPYVVKALPEILSKHKIDVLITTGPPHSTHLIGLEMKRECNIPWIADFRDPWTNIYYNKIMPRTTRTKRIDSHLESSVLKESDFVIVVSRQVKREFCDRTDNIELIYNGYDDSDFAKIDENDNPIDNFVILHTGNLSSSQNTIELWNALADISDKNKSFKNDLVIRFIGNTDINIIDYLKSKGFSENIDIVDYVPHHKAVAMMTQASLLLLVIPNTDNNEGIITGKLFEYLASGSPIIAIGPVNGDAADILSETGRSPMIGFNDTSAMKERLIQAYTIWVENDKTTPKYSGESCKQFSRKNATQQLVELLNRVSTWGTEQLKKL